MSLKGTKARMKQIMCLLVTAVMLFSHICTVQADSNGMQQAVSYSSADAIFNLDGIKPAEYDKLVGNIYGKGDTPFLLTEQNELFLFWADDNNTNAFNYENLDMKIVLTEKDYSWVKTPNKTNSVSHSGYRQGMFKTVTEKNVTKDKCLYRFVQGIGLDATGSGRKDHAAYVGIDSENYVCVIFHNQRTGAIYKIRLDRADWIGTAKPFAFEMENLIAITAGDYDGDGLDSVIVYSCGNDSDVSLYEIKLIRGALFATKIRSLSSDMVNSEYNNNSTKYKPVVSLTTGDFNGDGRDQLAYSFGFHNTSGKADKGWENKAVGSIEFFATGVCIAAYDSGWSFSAPMWMYDRAENPISYNASTETAVYQYTVMMGGSITAGDVDKDGKDEIVVAGYTSKEARGTIVNGKFSSVTGIGLLDKENMLTAVINGNVDSKENISYNRAALSKLGMSEFMKHSVDKYYTKYFMFPRISVASVKTNGKAAEADVFIAGILYNFKSGKASAVYTPKLMTETFNKIMDDVETGTDVYWIGNVAVGNFDHNEVGREQIVYTVWFKESGTGKRNCNVYLGIAGGSVYDDTTDASGNITSIGKCTQYAGSNIRGDYGEYIDRDAEHASKIIKERDGSYMSVVPIAMDLDDDGLLARYSKTSYLYTDPEILAVLQAGPYFAEIDDMGGYQDPCGTSYTVETSYGYASSTGNNVSFGAGFAGEVSAGIGKLSLELGYSLDWSESFEKAYEKSDSATFLAQEHNTVILSRTPELWYSFDIYQDGKWIHDGHTVQIPLSPTYYQLSIDDYNDFAKKYNDKYKTKDNPEPFKEIDASYLPAGNEGNPFGYWKNWQDAGDNAVKLSKQSYQLGYAGGAMASEWSESASVTEATEITHGFSYNMTLQFGGGIGGSAGEAWAGGYVSLDYGYVEGSSKTKTSANGAAGQVQNISENTLISAGMTQAQVRSYGFSWDFIKWTRNLKNGGAAVPFYGYSVFGVTAPAPQVEDFRAQFRTGGNEKLEILLEWENPATLNRPVGCYVLYEYDETGARKQLAVVNGDVTSYVFDRVNGREDYKFGIVAKTNNYTNIESIETTTLLHLSTKSIYDILYSKTVNGEDIYTIYYTDGTTADFMVRRGVGIASVKLTGTQDGSDTYTITMTDGETTAISIPHGEKGEKGDKGETGAQGAKGDRGEKGETGAQGAKGDKGEKGETGAQGAKGDRGEKGETGAQGAKGDQGEKGETGAQGAKGDKGDKGETGAPGAKGDQGEKGETGAQGEKGEAGTPGRDGLDGKDGKDGADGKDGIGVSDVTIKDGSLIITLSDGRTINAGSVLTEKEDIDDEKVPLSDPDKKGENQNQKGNENKKDPGTDPKPENSIPWWIIYALIGSNVVLLGGGVALAMVVKNRK